MARDLSLLLSPPAGVGALDDEATADRIGEIVALADASEHARAADRAAALLHDGVLDIRAVSFLLYQVCREEGLAGTTRVFEVLVAALGPLHEAYGPAKRREEHFNKRLAWLFTKVADYLAYDRKNDTPEWQALLGALDAPSLDQAREAGAAAAAGLRDEVYGDAWRALSQLLDVLRELEELVPEPESPSEEPAALSASTEAALAAPPSPAPAGVEEQPVGRASPASRPTPGPARGAEGAVVEIPVSPHFHELMKKLQAFDALIARGELGKAAVVAEDVQQLVESFDPRVYFPALFASFGAGLSEHIEVIEEHLRDRDSMAFKARSQFYRVDLPGFVRS